MGADGVPVVIPGNDRRFLRVLQPGPQPPQRSTELGRQRGRRQVARDQDVLGVEREHPLDDFLDPFEPKLPRPAHYERRHSQQTLAEELQRIEGIPPEMDVRDVNQPERAGIERHRGSRIAVSLRGRGAKSIRESRWQMANGKWQMVNGKWQMADGRWQMADGRWQMADGKWQMANGRWQMADGK